MLLLTPALVAGVIADEKQRKTLHYLMASRLSSAEIVLGKLLVRMLYVTVLLGVSLPVLSLLVLLGGIDPRLGSAVCRSNPEHRLVSGIAFDLGLDHCPAGSRGIFHRLWTGMPLAILTVYLEDASPSQPGPCSMRPLTGLPNGLVPVVPIEVVWRLVLFHGHDPWHGHEIGSRAHCLDDGAANSRSGSSCRSLQHGSCARFFAVRIPRAQPGRFVGSFLPQEEANATASGCRARKIRLLESPDLHQPARRRRRFWHRPALGESSDALERALHRSPWRARPICRIAADRNRRRLSRLQHPLDGFTGNPRRYGSMATPREPTTWPGRIVSHSCGSFAGLCR